MAEVQKIEVTNISEGARGINAVSGLVMIDPKASAVVEITAAERKSAESTGYFEFRGNASLVQEPGPLDGSVDELEKHLSTIEDADEIQRLIDAETAGKSRKGALAALEARRDAILSS
jgi:hypothetical protein